MWRIKNIKATNICTFQKLDYSPLQGHTTLIFGHNLDNESQGSNGSGKSALIEAFAIALTGESLRKVGTEEIINDAFEEAEVICELSNDVTKEKLVIRRKLSRNSSTDISIALNDEQLVLSSVLEYNRYILDKIGLKKEDIFSNYILSKHRYTSFLNASDRIKKELINRFSNGALVDISLEYLTNDINEAKEKGHEIEKQIAFAEGKVSTIQEEINSILRQADYNRQRKLEMIEAHEEAIARHRAQIREQKSIIENCNKRLDGLDALDEAFRKLEDGGENIDKCHKEILRLFNEHGYTGCKIKDYHELSGNLSDTLTEYENRIAELESLMADLRHQINDADSQCDELMDEYEKIQYANTPKTRQLKSEIQEARLVIEKLNKANNETSESIITLKGRISSIKAILKGVIECPSCHHKFSLDSNESVESMNKKLASLDKNLKKEQNLQEKNEKKIASSKLDMENKKNEIEELDVKVYEASIMVKQAKHKAEDLKDKLTRTENKLETARTGIERTRNQILNLRKNLFDEAFDIIDEKTRENESSIQRCEISISNAKGNISSYQDAIKELKESKSELSVEHFENRKATYQKDLELKQAELEVANAGIDELIKQESRFIDFKTHLANSKIEALGQLTNEYLEAIGSDIRISFSGYTILKSGKVREKISISLLRDGLDCGLFAKFSAGEQCRVNLASILALHKLTNANCDEGKGLDFLILDEILDATDEAGLANMFEALNSLQITSMVVSHGQIAEAYPYRLTITKQNGISTLNESNS